VPDLAETASEKSGTASKNLKKCKTYVFLIKTFHPRREKSTTRSKRNRKLQHTNTTNYSLQLLASHETRRGDADGWFPS
jgi:hypothetical protein